MKKRFFCLVLAIICLSAFCVPASAAGAQTLTVTGYGQTFEISPYHNGDQLTTIPVTDATELPALPEDFSGTVTLRHLPLAADGTDAAADQEKTVFTGTAAELAAFGPHRNGTYTYLVKPSGTDTEYRFEAHIRANVRVRLSSEGAALGETMAIYADFADHLTVTATTTLAWKPKFYDTDNGKMALLPVSYFTAPGSYSLTVTVADGEPANTQTHSYKIDANKRDFVVQNLTVDNSTASSTINNDAAVREWNELIEPLKYITDSQKYWDGKFLLPVQGRITTQFGTIRYTNGSKDASRHGATDIAAATGTPVPAANAGRVIFAQFIQMSGNVVVIEHGMGLKTWYFHMSEIDTKVGDMVKKGDIIGKVGATGFVTGPHLHFGMSVNDVYINPMTAVEYGVG